MSRRQTWPDHNTCPLSQATHTVTPWSYSASNIGCTAMCGRKFQTSGASELQIISLVSLTLQAPSSSSQVFTESNGCPWSKCTIIVGKGSGLTHAQQVNRYAGASGVLHNVVHVTNSALEQLPSSNQKAEIRNIHNETNVLYDNGTTSQQHRDIGGIGGTYYNKSEHRNYRSHTKYYCRLLH